MPEYDLPAAIQRLAAAQWPCPCITKGGLVCSTCAPSPYASVVLHGATCQCGGTGRIVPFAALRLETAIARVAHEILHGPECKEVAWVPEPDVRVAYWEIIKAHPDILRSLHAKSEPVTEHALFKQAEAWVEEQRRVKRG